jgi:hypothetical protein
MQVNRQTSKNPAIRRPPALPERMHLPASILAPPIFNSIQIVVFQTVVVLTQRTQRISLKIRKNATPQNGKKTRFQLILFDKTTSVEQWDHIIPPTSFIPNFRTPDLAQIGLSRF